MFIFVNFDSSITDQKMITMQLYIAGQKVNININQKFIIDSL